MRPNALSPESIFPREPEGELAIEDSFQLLWHGVLKPARDQVARHWWLMEESHCVAYAKSVGTLPRGPVELQDIEVRPGHRRRGVSKVLLDGMSRALSHEVLSQGHYTSEGARALGHLRLAPGFDQSHHPLAVTFVARWDLRLPRYP